MEYTVRDVKIYYEIHGEGTPVLMIHGWSPDHRLMKGCMEPVFQTLNTPWKRIYFDLPGMGKTKGEPWIDCSDRVLDLILNFVDAVIPNQHFIVAGESYGGYLARGIVHQRPEVVDGVLLICPWTGKAVYKKNDARFQVLERDNALLSSLSEEDRKSFETKGIQATLNRSVWQRYQEEIVPGLQAADYAYLEKLGQRNTLSFDVDALERPFAKPSLFLTGRQDSIVGYRRLWEIIEKYPRASFVLLDKAAHNLQIEQDVLFSAAVKEWLDRVSAEMRRVKDNHGIY